MDSCCAVNCHNMTGEVDCLSDEPGGSPEHPESDCQSEVSLTSLHELYQHGLRPLDIHRDTLRYLQRGAPVNALDDLGSTAISLLVLHVNRGLRYHMYRVPQLARLEDQNAAGCEITKACLQIDREYKEQVHKCLVELLAKGADCNIVPATCPGIPYDAAWSENYEHKIMQSDQRWNLFALGGNMEFTTYSIFNPLSRHRPLNTNGVTVLHLAAWRGDAPCLRLLLQHGADVHATTADNRNALHFLYLYCNKPDDVAECTQLLTQQGIDVNCSDSRGHTPLFVLLNHFLVKRSHVKYLANCYTADSISSLTWRHDHYQEAIQQSIECMVDAGARVTHRTRDNQGALHHIYRRFQHSLTNCEPQFQVKGHHLVPYHFRVTPLVEFSQFLLRLGCQVNTCDDKGRTPLLLLVDALRNLSLDQNLNSSDSVCQCFQVLLAAGAQVNAKDHFGKSALHHLVETACTTRNALERYLSVMKLLASQGADCRTQDNKGNSLLHLVLGSSMRSEPMQRLLVFLLQCSADPNLTNVENKYALNNLMRQHIHHHDPLCLGGVALRLDHYLHTVDLICKAMSLSTLGYVFSVYRESGFWGVICEEQCLVHKLLKKHCTTVRSLKEGCRLAIWRAMGPRFAGYCQELPLPKEIVRYVYELVS